MCGCEALIKILCSPYACVRSYFLHTSTPSLMTSIVPLPYSPLGFLSTSDLMLAPALAAREFGAGLPAFEYGDLRFRMLDMMQRRRRGVGHRRKRSSERSEVEVDPAMGGAGAF